MNVNSLYNQLHGVGFVKPPSTNRTKTVSKTTSAFARTPTTPVYVPPPKAPARTTVNLPTTSNRPAGASALPFYDRSRAYQYSAEQILEMKKRAAGISDGGPDPRLIWPGEIGDNLEHLEITDPQRSPHGNGIDVELETESIQADATDKAIRDSKAAGGGGMPIIDGGSAPDKTQELLPLAALGALLYFIF